MKHIWVFVSWWQTKWKYDQTPHIQSDDLQGFAKLLAVVFAQCSVSTGVICYPVACCVEFYVEIV